MPALQQKTSLSTETPKGMASLPHGMGIHLQQHDSKQIGIPATAHLSRFVTLKLIHCSFFFVCLFSAVAACFAATALRRSIASR
jgi:hypothetical protein